VHYIRTADLDNDGSVEIVVGGRGTAPRAGLQLYRLPEGVAPGRDLSQWELYYIDADLESGHGFVFGDLDADNDTDIALANSDWDTPDDRDMVLWYENPGDITRRWAKHEIKRIPGLYTKEQVAIADLDADGRSDIVLHTEESLLIFRNRGTAPLTWEEIAVPKPESAQWRARPVAVADLNNDGRPDLVGMLIHRDGSLPRDKTAVFWLENRNAPGALVSEAWTFHTIKQADGFPGAGRYNGEKWDQVVIADIDRDGDLDIAANCEEYNTASAVLAVVWFENPLY
jgi:hypothetical protein